MVFQPLDGQQPGCDIHSDAQDLKRNLIWDYQNNLSTEEWTTPLNDSSVLTSYFRCFSVAVIKPSWPSNSYKEEFIWLPASQGSKSVMAGRPDTEQGAKHTFSSRNRERDSNSGNGKEVTSDLLPPVMPHPMGSMTLPKQSHDLETNYSNLKENQPEKWLKELTIRPLCLPPLHWGREIHLFQNTWPLAKDICFLNKFSTRTPHLSFPDLREEGAGRHPRRPAPPSGILGRYHPFSGIFWVHL